MAENNRKSSLVAIMFGVAVVVAVVLIVVLTPRPGTQPVGNRPDGAAHEGGSGGEEGSSGENLGGWGQFASATTILVKAEDVQSMEGKMKLGTADDDGDAAPAKVQFVYVEDEACAKEEDPAQHKAILQMQVEKPGTYYPWVRVWWKDSCGDSVVVTLQHESEQEAQRLPVTDETHERWQWLSLSGPGGIQLKEGTYRVVVENREDGARLSRILFTTRGYESYMPSTPEG